jgi:hypothetical protein
LALNSANKKATQRVAFFYCSNKEEYS